MLHFAQTNLVLCIILGLYIEISLKLEDDGQISFESTKVKVDVKVQNVNCRVWSGNTKHIIYKKIMVFSNIVCHLVIQLDYYNM